MPEAAKINPELFVWARETAGLSLEEAADRLGLNDTAKSTAVEKLQAIEAGEIAASEAQIRTAAKTYRRPLISFYLPHPPARGERGEDFRTAPAAMPPRENGLLDALMRDMRARQLLVSDILTDDETVEPLSFVASARIVDGSPHVTAAIRNQLGISEGDQRTARGPSALFDLLRRATERAGVYVLLLGDLGSHHSDIGEDVFRGLAMADDYAPFIVINDNDAVTARSFTLLHELAHIWIGASGVSGPLVADSMSQVERFCNAVAGEFLLPGLSTADAPDLLEGDAQTVQRVTADLAEKWNVSEGVVTYRLLLDKKITSQTASQLFGLFAARWRAEKSRRTTSSSGTGPSYYTVRRHRLGEGLLGVVRRAIQDEAITHTRAAKILGVAPVAIDRLLQERIRVA